MYAFENSLHVVGLVGGIVGVRAAVPRMACLRAHRIAVLEILDSGLIAVLLVFCILRPFVIQTVYIPSGSMEPTLRPNDRVLVNKFLYYFKPPAAGDVVVFDAPSQALHPDEPKKDFIKRVVGVPGDRIAVRGGRLWRNGAPVEEPYLQEPPLYTWPRDALWDEEVVVKPGQVFVFGDNRNRSNDSHAWLAVAPDGSAAPAPGLPSPNILGKAMVIFWPPQRVGLLR